MTDYSKYVPGFSERSSEPVTVHHGFGVNDTKGRGIGARITTFILTYKARTDGQRSGTICDPDKIGKSFFAFVPQATRGGVPYGASQVTQEFSTEAERDAAIAKYLAGAAKRAMKGAKS